MKIGEIVWEGEREVPGFVPHKEQPKEPAREPAPSEPRKAPETVPA